MKKGRISAALLSNATAGSNGNDAAQKYVVAVVLVPLSHEIVTVQFLNCGTAGTILRSYLELACNANARLKLSVA